MVASPNLKLTKVNKVPSHRIPGSLCACVFAAPDTGAACLWQTAAPGSLCSNELSGRKAR